MNSPSPHPPHHSTARVVLVALALLLAVAAGTRAQTTAADRERQASHIEAKLMAPCCFAQQVSVHKSPAADDARADIRSRLAAGETEQQILDAYVAQHGKHVLAEPPAEGFDVTLYVAPFVLLVASLGFLVLIARRFTQRAPALAAGPASSTALDQRLTDELRDLD
jgi:cytochrome c-type biogenesis protein CcmH